MERTLLEAFRNGSNGTWVTSVSVRTVADGDEVIVAAV
jgi:hypothetical protein